MARRARVERGAEGEIERESEEGGHAVKGWSD